MAPQRVRKSVAVCMVMVMSLQLQSWAFHGGLTLGGPLSQGPGPVNSEPRLRITALIMTLQLHVTQDWLTCGIVGFALLSSILDSIEAGESDTPTSELQVESRAASWKSP
mmetsp:Transcript_17487/g.41162  ORF Transcript_17487/g.41162 Transcript_17487/m.41162 type:complete len:110 (-) Transcript_17487:319-648(-)